MSRLTVLTLAIASRNLSSKKSFPGLNKLVGCNDEIDFIVAIKIIIIIIISIKCTNNGKETL